MLFRSGDSPNVGAVLCLADNNNLIIRNYTQVDGSWRSADTAEFVQTNKWYHIVSTYDGQYLRVYVDGNEAGSSYNPGIMTNSQGSSSSNITIGGRACNSRHWFNGFIDEVQVYNRALSNIEVKSIYNIPEPQNFLLIIASISLLYFRLRK